MFSITIQDAIRVTRKLNVRYIWIDSLCILHDSKVDWAREAQTMGDVYANCLLTIEALGASNSGQGFFGRRDPLVYKPCLMFQRDKQDLFALPRSSFTQFDHCFNDAALHSRGWVMQERILSPRTLNFGISLAWECRQKLFDEYVTPNRMDGRSLKRRFFLWQDSNSDIAPHDEYVVNDFVLLWNAILTAYTKSELSFKSDRLVAISGIIRLLERCTGWTNIAGLWRPFILQQLLWERLGAVQGHRNRASPSWSWWVLDNPVRFPVDLSGIVISSHSYRSRKGVISMRELAALEAIEETELGRDGLKLYSVKLTCMMAAVKTLPGDR